VGAASEMLRQWTACVKDDLLAGLHGHLCKALAAVSLAVALAGHCHSGRVAPMVPGPARPASARRRFERLLANPRLRARSGELPAASGMLARAVLSCWSGREVVLILDETPGRGGLRCLRVSAGYRGRAVPLAWACYREGDLPDRMPRLVWRLLRRVARCLPPGASAVLVADRGLSWPSVVDCCTMLGWHYVLRVQGTTRVQVADGRGGRVREVEARSLAPREGDRWSGRVRAFKKAGWRAVHLTAVREPGCGEPWLLACDRPGGPSRHVRQYCKRAWCEQSHRDDKSSAFNWDRSRVSDPAHACRLLLVLALATLPAVSLGARVLKRGLRRVLEGRLRRTLSLVQLGLRWLRHAALAADAYEPVPCTAYLPP
jgi:hypothetical protein